MKKEKLTLPSVVKHMHRIFDDWLLFGYYNNCLYLSRNNGYSKDQKRRIRDHKNIRSCLKNLGTLLSNAEGLPLIEKPPQKV